MKMVYGTSVKHHFAIYNRYAKIKFPAGTPINLAVKDIETLYFEAGLVAGEISTDFLKRHCNPCFKLEDVEKELEALPKDSPHKPLDEALNSGDGSYKP